VEVWCRSASKTERPLVLPRPRLEDNIKMGCVSAGGTADSSVCRSVADTHWTSTLNKPLRALHCLHPMSNPTTVSVDAFSRRYLMQVPEWAVQLPATVRPSERQTAWGSGSCFNWLAQLGVAVWLIHRSRHPYFGLRLDDPRTTAFPIASVTMTTYHNTDRHTNVHTTEPRLLKGRLWCWHMSGILLATLDCAGCHNRWTDTNFICLLNDAVSYTDELQGKWALLSSN
jgi:hypothetical protein